MDAEAAFSAHGLIIRQGLRPGRSRRRDRGRLRGGATILGAWFSNMSWLHAVSALSGAALRPITSGIPLASCSCSRISRGLSQGLAAPGLGRHRGRNDLEYRLQRLSAGVEVEILAGRRGLSPVRSIVL